MPRLIDISIPLARGLPTGRAAPDSASSGRAALSSARAHGVTTRSGLSIPGRTSSRRCITSRVASQSKRCPWIPWSGRRGRGRPARRRMPLGRTSSMLQASPDGTERLLLRTRNSGLLQPGEEFARTSWGSPLMKLQGTEAAPARAILEPLPSRTATRARAWRLALWRSPAGCQP